MSETETTKPLEGRVALVTGASRGIGRAAALRFAREGAHVILTARTQGALEELDDEIAAFGGSASLVPADLTDYDVIDKMGGAVYERFKRLDVLLGNAGVLGALSPLCYIDPALWEKTLALDVTVNWRLIRSFDPLLRASDSGRVIFVTSSQAHEHKAYWGLHAAGKAALEALALTYAHEVANEAVRVNLVDPGPTRTGFRAKAFPGEDPESVKPPEALTDIFLELALASCTRNGEIIKADEG